MNYKDIRLTSIASQEEKDTELSAGFDPAKMSSDEIRKYIVKCEDELGKRRNKRREEAWVKLREAFAEAFDAGLYISFEDGEDFFVEIHHINSIKMDEIGTIYIN